MWVTYNGTPLSCGEKVLFIIPANEATKGERERGRRKEGEKGGRREKGKREEGGKEGWKWEEGWDGEKERN